MVIALIAPEVVVVWAMRQCWVARRLAQVHENRGWTQCHGFFAIMGGFTLSKDSKASRILMPDQLKSLSDADEISFPEITEKEIQDKSKGDGLSKGLAIVQTGWFVLQCIARGVERLPVTELEIVTLAFALLNFATYVLWWNKPLNVRCGVRIVSRASSGNGDGVDSKDDEKEEPEYTDWSVHMIARNAFKHIMSRARHYLGYIFHPFAASTGISVDFEGRRVKRMPTFYAGPGDDSEKAYTYFATGLVAMIFGAIHCIAWSFHFPSRTEQMFWRISSIVIVSTPTFYTLLLLLKVVFSSHWVSLHSLPKWVRALLLTFSLTLYVLARVTLLVLAVTSLRSLPSGAYQTVNWTTYIPHV